VDELHRRLIRVGLEALAGDHGYALAGGYAIQAHHIVERPSDDVDLFVPIDRRHEMPLATALIAAAYERDGLAVEVRQRAETYVRLHVTEPATQRWVKVELVAEFLLHAPVPSELGPVLHRDDVAAGKTEALFSRAEVRDFIDVDALLRAGYTRQQLIHLAAERDAGFDRAVFAEMLGSVRRFNDRQFGAYAVDAASAEAIRKRFLAWQAELRDGGSQV
jgi:hypothetical protein